MCRRWNVDFGPAIRDLKESVHRLHMLLMGKIPQVPSSAQGPGTVTYGADYGNCGMNFGNRPKPKTRSMQNFVHHQYEPVPRKHNVSPSGIRILPSEGFRV